MPHADVQPEAGRRRGQFDVGSVLDPDRRIRLRPPIRPDLRTDAVLRIWRQKHRHDTRPTAGTILVGGSKTVGRWGLGGVVLGTIRGAVVR